MSVRESVQEVVCAGDLAALESLVEGEIRTVRHLLGMTYSPDPELREVACRGLGIASRFHPHMVTKVIRRLVWAMNDESGTNALTAPAVLAAVARENPSLLLPVVPDLFRLSTDDGLRGGIGDVLSVVAEGCPGQVGPRLSAELNQQLERGEPSGTEERA